MSLQMLEAIRESGRPVYKIIDQCKEMYNWNNDQDTVAWAARVIFADEECSASDIRCMFKAVKALQCSAVGCGHGSSARNCGGSW